MTDTNLREACEECGGSRSKAVYLDGHTHCFKCGKTGAPPETAAVEEEPAFVEPKTIPTVKVRGKKTAAFLDVEYQSIPSRALRADTCEKWHYGVSTFKGKPCHVAQFYDPQGKLCGQKVRLEGKEFVIIGDLKPAGLFGQSLWRDEGKMVVVTEGELDALSVSQVQENKWPVVSVPNGAQSAHKAVAASVEWLEKFEKVVFMLDMDEAGRAASVKCAEVLSPGKAYIAQLPLKDANEMLVAGRRKDLVDAIWGAKVYRPDSIVMGTEMLQRILGYDLAEGARWPVRKLNEMTCGMHPGLGEVVALVAGTGTGKSTFCKEVAVDLVGQNEKLLYIGLEEPVERAAIGLAAVLLDKPLHLMKNADIRAAGVETAWAKLEKNVVFYDHFGTVAPDVLMAKIRYASKALGVKFVILDHLSIVASGIAIDADERRTLDAAMTTISTMAQEMGVCIIVVVHLRRTDGKPHEEGKHVTLADLRGSHGIGQLAHTIVALERDQQSEDESDATTVRVLKARLTGRLGEAGQMRYDHETGRLREFSSEFEEVLA